LKPSPKYIFVTGGVVSGIGKGVTCASIGRILKARRFEVSIMKLDPYINVDPGTMSPAQHGEVFVTIDGAETDLDLGHYERFIDVPLTRASNVTSGQVYEEVIKRERRGDFLGGTIQVIPHVTDGIKRHVKRLGEESEADVVIVEVGGTVGDIEGLPFLEALRQLRREIGPENVMYVHLTFLVHIGATGELKTKPTQHSVATLRGIGILPDILACRTDFPFQPGTREKLALFCDVEDEAVIPLESVDNIYAVPLFLEEAGLGRIITRKLNLPERPVDLRSWQRLIDRMTDATRPLDIALVGKYVHAADAYISVEQAIRHAGINNGQRPNIRWIDSERLDASNIDAVLAGVDGIVVPGGFGPRGIEGKVEAGRYARVNNIPYLGLCLGLQTAVIEFARNVLHLESANSIEFDAETGDPVIWPMPDHYGAIDMGGTMRLGEQPCLLTPGTRAAAAYGVDLVNERHRHRMEFNNDYRERMTAAGMELSGINPDKDLVEIIELHDHPWFVAVQFHPEFTSRPDAPHPLFDGFVKAATARSDSDAPGVEIARQSSVS
jgi:CTP synthase